MMRLSNADMAAHPGRSRLMSVQDLANRGEIDWDWANRSERMWRYYEQWWAEVRDEPDLPAS
jgi:hypothetical protein